MGNKCPVRHILKNMVRSLPETQGTKNFERKIHFPSICGKTAQFQKKNLHQRTNFPTRTNVPYVTCPVRHMDTFTCRTIMQEWLRKFFWHFAMKFLDKCSILTASLAICSSFTFREFWDCIYCLKITNFCDHVRHVCINYHNASLTEVRKVFVWYNKRGTIGCFRKQNKLAQIFSLLETE